VDAIRRHGLAWERCKIALDADQGRDIFRPKFGELEIGNTDEQGLNSLLIAFWGSKNSDKVKSRKLTISR
jgi:hypothetical protein